MFSATAATRSWSRSWSLSVERNKNTHCSFGEMLATRQQTELQLPACMPAYSMSAFYLGGLLCISCRYNAQYPATSHVILHVGSSTWPRKHCFRVNSTSIFCPVVTGRDFHKYNIKSACWDPSNSKGRQKVVYFEVFKKYSLDEHLRLTFVNELLKRLIARSQKPNLLEETSNHYNSGNKTAGIILPVTLVILNHVSFSYTFNC